MWPADTVLDEPSKSSRRRLKGGNTTAPVDSLRKFFRWSSNGKLSKKETKTPKWHANPKWTKLTEWLLDEDEAKEDDSV